MQADTAQAGILNIVVHVMQAGILAPAHLHVLIVLQASILRQLKYQCGKLYFMSCRQVRS